MKTIWFTQLNPSIFKGIKNSPIVSNAVAYTLIRISNFSGIV